MPKTQTKKSKLNEFLDRDVKDSLNIVKKKLGIYVPIADRITNTEESAGKKFKFSRGEIEEFKNTLIDKFDKCVYSEIKHLLKIAEFANIDIADTLRNYKIKYLYIAGNEILFLGVITPLMIAAKYGEAGHPLIPKILMRKERKSRETMFLAGTLDNLTFANS